MAVANLLRAIVFAITAGYIIFNQDHGYTTAGNAVEFAGAAITLAGGALMFIPNVKVPYRILAVPVSVSFFCAYFVFLEGEFGGLTSSANHFLPRTVIAIFIAGSAVTEFGLCFDKSIPDQLEVRISAAIGMVATFFFLLAPLDIANTVGFFSAYLAISAVQRAVWVFSPKKEPANG